MAKRKNTAQEKDSFQSVESALSRAENFIEKRQKPIITVFIVILVIVIGIVLYNNFIRKPKIKEAWAEAYKAEYYFEQDSFRLALEGDGVYSGFLDIIDDYGSTPMGNAAKYYAGVCYMRLGEYETAIEYLKSFKGEDSMVGAMAINLIGDANMELGNKDAALKNYIKASDIAGNEFLSPLFLMKAGRTCELLEDYKQALSIYTKIETDYYGTQQQREVEKYIERVKTKM